MKTSDIKPGITYFYDRSNKWARYQSYQSGAIVFDEPPSADWKEGGVSWRRSMFAVAAGTGTHIRGRVVPDVTKEGEEPAFVYVRPQWVRATLDDAKAAQQAETDAQLAIRQDEKARRAAADKQAEELINRLAAAGIPTGYDPHQVRVRVDSTTNTVGVTMSGKALANLLDTFDN